MFASSKIILFKSVVQHGRQRLFKFIIGQIQKKKEIFSESTRQISNKGAGIMYGRSFANSKFCFDL